MAERQFVDAKPVHRLIKLAIKIVDPELVEIAKDDIARAVGDGVELVFKRLPVMELQLLPAFFHFEEQAGLPDQIGKAGAFGGLFLDPVFEGSASFFVSSVPERLKQPVTKDLRFALFITVQQFGIG